VETPILFKSSAEGASEFAVASAKHDWWKFSLPQSPQQFKQMLMIGGIAKYFQIARCFRDEDLRADRQPEFTQVDIEMTFAQQEDVISVTERFLQRIFALFTSERVPIRKMTFKEAMQNYGSDKSDLRIEGLEIVEEKIS
jgi:aspartyl-tRNA synthetase